MSNYKSYRASSRPIVRSIQHFLRAFAVSTANQSDPLSWTIDVPAPVTSNLHGFGQLIRAEKAKQDCVHRHRARIVESILSSVPMIPLLFYSRSYKVKLLRDFSRWNDHRTIDMSIDV